MGGRPEGTTTDVTRPPARRSRSIRPPTLFRGRLATAFPGPLSSKDDFFVIGRNQMIALALALRLAAAAGPDETDLPRSLSVDETPYLVAPAPAAEKADLSFWVGGHLGIAGAYDADNP